MNRRTLLFTIPAAAAAFAAESPSLVRVGCQTNAWPVDAKNVNSLLQVLGSIKQLGFAGFETGFRNLQSEFANPQAMRAKIAGSGLQFFGIHIFLLKYDPETSIAPWDLLTSVADGGATLGAARLIVSGAPTPDRSALAKKAEGLNRIGRYCHDKGLGLAYHNHHPEFEQSGYQIEGLLQQTDPALVHLVVDAGHAIQAGADIAQFFSRYADRIDGIHLRDSRQGKEVPLGQGEHDWRPLASAIQKAGWKGWLLCEEERESGEKPGDLAMRPARQAVHRIFHA